MSSDEPTQPGVRDEPSVATPDASQPLAFELALATDVGTERDNNEDAHGFHVEGADSVVFAVADGVGGYEGGEVASRMAIDVTLETYRGFPATWGPAKRLARAVQRANIAIHDRALVVTELRRMATTLSAVSITAGVLNAVHVGDCRIYLIRSQRITQLTKDHTVAGQRARIGLLAKEQLRQHPERGMLTRSLGPELIAAIDRFATPLLQHDALLIASDGLHATLTDDELLAVIAERSAAEACRTLIETANRKGTGDNLTAAVYRQTAPLPVSRQGGLRARLATLLGRRGATRE